MTFIGRDSTRKGRVKMEEATLEARGTNERSKIQFSIKTLLIATTVIAILLGLAMVPNVVAIVAAAAIIFLYPACITACVTAAISGRGWVRPFSIAAGIYLIVAGFILMSTNGPPIAWLVFSFINLAISFCIGLCTAIVHGFLAKRKGIIPVPNVWLLRNWLHNPPE